MLYLTLGILYFEGTRVGSVTRVLVIKIQRFCDNLKEKDHGLLSGDQVETSRDRPPLNISYSQFAPLPPNPGCNPEPHMFCVPFMTSVNPEISCIRMGSGPALFGLARFYCTRMCVGGGWYYPPPDKNNHLVVKSKKITTS